MAWNRLAELECDRMDLHWTWDALKGFDLTVSGRKSSPLEFHRMALLRGDRPMRLIIEVDDGE